MKHLHLYSTAFLLTQALQDRRARGGLLGRMDPRVRQESKAEEGYKEDQV